MFKRIFVLVTALYSIFILITCSKGVKLELENYILSAPTDKEYCQIKENGTAVIPNGRRLTPIGKLIRVAPHPYGICLSPDGQILVTANSGTGPFSLSVIRNFKSDSPKVDQIPKPGQEADGVLETVFMGLVIPRDSKRVYASSGGEGDIRIFDLQSLALIDTIELNGQFWDGKYEDGYIGEMALAQDDSIILALDQANFRLVVINRLEKSVIQNIPVGRYPFGVAVSKDHNTAYVANVGMFEYSYVNGFDKNRPDETSLKFPPFGFPSKAAELGTVSEGITVPGLGDPNVPESFSVWTIDISKPQEARVIAKVKTGHLVGESLENDWEEEEQDEQKIDVAVGGSGPNSIVVSEKYVFVSNGNNDCITVIDTKTNKVITDINLYLTPLLRKYRGLIPFGLCMSFDEKRLYVAEAGINAIGIIDVEKLEFLGHFPTGWFPSKMSLGGDSKTLFVANAKGLGAGPNAGQNHQSNDPTNVGKLMRGMVQITEIPSDRELDKLNQMVIDNNVKLMPINNRKRDKNHPIPLSPGTASDSIKYIVYVTKENRTFDEVFGALEGANGDPEISLYGVPRSYFNEKTGQTVENVVAMPNHIALAKRFTIVDNFYCDSDHSADGHRWLVDTYPNEWVETATSAHYGGGKRDQSAKAKGRLGFTGASGAMYPEDYNEAGSIWEHFERNQITFWNFGLGFEFAGSFEEQHHKYTGIRLSVNYPMPKPLFERTSRFFATYNTNIPDQFRMDMFEDEFKRRWLSDEEPFPQVLTMMLPNDHSASPRPKDGYPFRASYMADNDLALGRLVELLSKSPFWKNMVIFVTEDDAQGGLDHIDAHRSLCMVLSPYVQPGRISKTHTSIVSIIKTIYLILGLPPLNLYDACTNDLSDCFVSSPVNLEPYLALEIDPELFNPEKALDPFDDEFSWETVNEYPTLDNPEFLRSERQAKYQDWLRKRNN